MSNAYIPLKYSVESFSAHFSVVFTLVPFARSPLAVHLPSVAIAMQTNKFVGALGSTQNHTQNDKGTKLPEILQRSYIFTCFAVYCLIKVYSFDIFPTFIAMSFFVVALQLNNNNAPKMCYAMRAKNETNNEHDTTNNI